MGGGAVGGVGEGSGHGGKVGQESLPATATASVPFGPVDTYAQASACAVPIGAPTSVNVSVTRANTRPAKADRVGSGPCTTQIIEPAAPHHARLPDDYPEGGTWVDRRFDQRARTRAPARTRVRAGAPGGGGRGGRRKKSVPR
ncbi:hypothetical protein GCM10022384_13640 [Streptomyces marokkonensis]|uniref:Uncharacterized protein n=1 Tax=Streptomyces marokkonensis TaxID=324855 RepID=A0ABP7PDF9_9ACTN